MVGCRHTGFWCQIPAERPVCSEQKRSHASSGAVSKTNRQASASGASCRRVLFLRGVQRHHPTGMVDGPGAIAAAGPDLSAERILQGEAVSGRIDAGMRNGPGDIGSEWRVHHSRRAVRRLAARDTVLVGDVDPPAEHGHGGDQAPSVPLARHQPEDLPLDEIAPLADRA